MAISTPAMPNRSHEYPKATAACGSDACRSVQTAAARHSKEIKAERLGMRSIVERPGWGVLFECT